MTRSLSLLLIIANDQYREQLESMLQKIKTFKQIYCVDSSEKAISILKHHYIDFVISEINIGILDGWRLTRMLRSKIFLSDRNIPIILMTPTYCEHIAETTARLFGVNAVLPFEYQQKLPNLITSILSFPQPLTEKLPVLVIEDTEDTAQLAKRMLHNRFEVDIAVDGRAGLEAFRKKTYDIILLDIMLPELSGQEVLQIILRERPNQTVVVMTAHGNMDLAEQLMMIGAADYIQKPFHADELRKVCEIAAKREDFMISNQQFADKVQALQSSEYQFRDLSNKHQRLLDHLSSVIIEINTEGKIQFINQAWKNLTGYSVNNCLNDYFCDYICDSIADAKNIIQRVINKACTKANPCPPIEFKLLNNLGKSVWVEGRFHVMAHNEEVIGLTATIDNITARKEAEYQLQHLATHDTLTELHNRYFFDTQLNLLSQHAYTTKSKNCLLYIDLDHFKVINDTQGHQQGDWVLKEVANTLNQQLRTSDIICRVGGDEFAVLLFDTNIQTANQLAEDLCAHIQSNHYQLGERIYKISCSIGIAQVNGEVTDALEYLKRADIALYVAKNRGRNLVHCFSENDKESFDFSKSVEWSHKLQEAIVNDNIVLHFQPVINIKTSQIEYYEALVRLQLDGELIFPGQFITALERAEEINLLDHQVVSKAIHSLHKYPQLKKVAINLSAQAFSDSRLVPLIEDKINAYGVNPNRIIFELTESASLSNLSATRLMISRLTELGCEFSIDDFGTGFSTFAYLKELPANSVKIDGSFVKDMVQDSIDLALVKAIHDVAKSLNKKSVAEFVESQEILDRLKAIGVDYAQGYFISKPMPIEQIKFTNQATFFN